MKQQKIIQKTNKNFSVTERHAIIQEWIATGCSKVAIWKKYTGEEEEHGQLLSWMRQLGYGTQMKIGRLNFENQTSTMNKKRKRNLKEDPNPSGVAPDGFETLQLKNRIKELEAQLKDAEMKAIAFSTMVDIAEKEFKIPIRKKFNTKP